MWDGAERLSQQSKKLGVILRLYKEGTRDKVMCNGVKVTNKTYPLYERKTLLCN